MNFAGKAALVTGGTKGIGRAVALALHGAGAEVMVCSRDEANVTRVVEEFAQTEHGRLAGVVCDVRNEAAVRNMMADVAARFGGLDILVNNAGVCRLAEVEHMSSEDWRATIDTNLTGTFYCCHYALPIMKSRGGGNIINMASRSSVNAYAKGSAYCASKFGLLGFSESLNLDVRGDNVRVSCIMPGRVSTDFAGEAPQDWHLTPEDIAKAVMDVLAFPPRVLASRIELRPSKPFA